VTKHNARLDVDVFLGVAVTLAGVANLPRVFSFAATQAMMTLTTLIILDLMAPSGWRIGLLRIEDIAMGAGVGMVVSLLLWPRGWNGTEIVSGPRI
jgi:uncharacterized membrane protein YccC